MTWTANADGSCSYSPSKAPTYCLTFIGPLLTTGGIHSGTWANLNLTAQGEQLHGRKRYDFASLSGCRELAKYLASRHPLPASLNWNDVLEATSIRLDNELPKGKQAVLGPTLQGPGAAGEYVAHGRILL